MSTGTVDDSTRSQAQLREQANLAFPSSLVDASTALTPAEVTAATEFFSPLPPQIKSKFRSDAFGDLLWFTAPAAKVPTVPRPTHSLDYLYWRAQQQQQQQQ